MNGRTGATHPNLADLSFPEEMSSIQDPQDALKIILALERGNILLTEGRVLAKLRSKRDHDRCLLRGTGKSLTQLDFKFMLTDIIDEARELRRNRFYGKQQAILENLNFKNNVELLKTIN